MPRAFVDSYELEALAADLTEASDEVVERVQRFITQAAHDTVVRMRSEAPHDRGTLVRSISADVDDDGFGAVIGPTATDDKGRPYPFFVEYGTSDTAPNPFVKRTADWAAENIPPRAAKMLEAIL